jgi:hypothetical protein
MIKKPFSELMTVYVIPSTVNQSLSNTLTLKNIKPGILVKGKWLFNTDIFTSIMFLDIIHRLVHFLKNTTFRRLDSLSVLR